MTEFWVSQAKYWCKFCKCWMTDSKSARSRHEQGNRHKQSVQDFLKTNRDKRKRDEQEKNDFEREMREIEKKARMQFKSDVELGQARWYDRPAPHGAAPPPPGHPGMGGAPPPPPPRPGGDHPAYAPPPPPPRPGASSTQDAKLAAELAKEGIILHVDQQAGEGEQGAEEAGEGHYQPEYPPGIGGWWQYKPIKEGEGEGGEATGAGKEGGSATKEGGGAAVKEEGAAEGAQVDGAAASDVYGPYDGFQMAEWAGLGYFSSGLGARIRQLAEDGEPCGAWQSTADLDSDEVLKLFVVGQQEEQEGAQGEAGGGAAEAKQETASIGQWQTVRIVNTKKEKQENKIKVKIMQDKQSKFFEAQRDEEDDADHVVTSGVHDKYGDAPGVLELKEEEEEPDSAPIAKPGAVSFNKGKGNAKAGRRNFRKKGGDDD